MYNDNYLYSLKSYLNNDVAFLFKANIQIQPKSPFNLVHHLTFLSLTK